MNTTLSMEIVNSQAAGIDVGSRSHFVSIGQNLDDVKEFGIYTKDHEELVKWLKKSKISTIAMESTGSYWQTLFTALQTAGFEVILVNARDIKNVKGKKTDVMDCMWIQKLHSLGLLRGSFLPDEETRQLRTLYDHRHWLIEQGAKYVLKMQKILRLMNIRLDVAIRDITGKTGRNIIESILSGERDPNKLAQLADIRIKKSKTELADSLKGNWKEDLLFVLRECLESYDFYRIKVERVDKKIESLLQETLSNKQLKIELPKLKKKKPQKNDPSFNLRAIAFKIYGIDLYQVSGVSNGLVLSLLSTLGKGIYKFPTSKHFVSWLRLAPNNKISGGRLISSRTPKGKNSLSLALRQAANAVGNAKEHPLKNFFSKVAFKKGRGAAITATARKLAVIIFNMIIKKEDFDPMYNRKQVDYRVQKIKAIKKSISILKLTDFEKELVMT
jgi:transposase